VDTGAHLYFVARAIGNITYIKRVLPHYVKVDGKSLELVYSAIQKWCSLLHHQAEIQDGQRLMNLLQQRVRNLKKKILLPAPNTPPPKLHP
jgi:hypothetical protein